MCVAFINLIKSSNGQNICPRIFSLMSNQVCYSIHMFGNHAYYSNESVKKIDDKKTSIFNEQNEINGGTEEKFCFLDIRGKPRIHFYPQFHSRKPSNYYKYAFLLYIIVPSLAYSIKCSHILNSNEIEKDLYEYSKKLRTCNR